jgi:uncharacterized membrane protein YjjP (DUF1212 family)
MVLFAYCLAAAGTVLLFGEDLPEALTAAVAGTGGRCHRSRPHAGPGAGPRRRAALLADRGLHQPDVSARIWPLDPRVATLGAVVVLLPGFTLTQGVRELQTRNLLSGSRGWARRR